MIGIPLAALALGERMGWIFYAGAALIAAGVWLAFGRGYSEPSSMPEGSKRRVSER